MQPGPLNPARLPPGTRVGPWRIVDLYGRGAYGAVYLVEGEGPEATGFAALKLALLPRDERFGREEALLSLIRHPCVPRLLASGRWRTPGRPPYPYLVMEWLEGQSLYAWGRAAGVTSRQVLGLLAELARALEATHSAGAVHRDVKGGNVLVRQEDGRGFLVDFGSGHYQGAGTLTWQVLPPGTPAYRSPEALRFARGLAEDSTERYAPGPADDLFALGVTAYRLVTGRYPPLAEAVGEGARVWGEEGPGPQPARELNACCAPELSGLIRRLLSLRPEERGSAGEVAEALEQAAREAGPEADVPLFPPKVSWPVEAEVVPWHLLRRTPRPVEEEATPASGEPPAPRGSWRPWLAVALTGAVALGAAWVLSAPSGREEAARAQVAQQAEVEDAGVVGVGDGVLTAPVSSTHGAFIGPLIAVDLPSKPFQGQKRPDANGLCPNKRQVAINGGCWWKLEGTSKECREDSYVYKGGCYAPVLRLQPPPTSSPTKSPDGR